ncbi:14232_t:CDS:2 [Ambispora leptoticha]|uniref:14232_t:CDS:1 n=1 Tax=Ambispora leptoticha TaxID=144679 RepID=A0A9N9A452_9GLOM|nr:14232_t:CDS:2 [Ambispora leptoticha]
MAKFAVGGQIIWSTLLVGLKPSGFNIMDIIFEDFWYQKNITADQLILAEEEQLQVIDFGTDAQQSWKKDATIEIDTVTTRSCIDVDNDNYLSSIFNGTSHEVPMTWLAEFNNVARSNGLNNAGKVACVVTYLQGAVGTWFDKRKANNDAWPTLNSTHQTIFVDISTGN